MLHSALSSITLAVLGLVLGFVSVPVMVAGLGDAGYGVYSIRENLCEPRAGGRRARRRPSRRCVPGPATSGGGRSGWVPNLRVGEWLRRLVGRCTDAELDRLVRAFAPDDVRELVRRTARFNWHRELILGLGRHPGLAALPLRSLFQ